MESASEDKPTAASGSGAYVHAPPPPPPPLPAALSETQRDACVALAYLGLKLTIEAKRKLSGTQRAALGSAVNRVIEVGCLCFTIAVAVWLRNKKELGNRLIPTSILAVCVHREDTRPFVRQAAKLVVQLPNDLSELLAEYKEVAAAAVNGGKATLDKTPQPSCLKKIARDVLDNLPVYQAGKYDSTTKIQRTKAQLKAAKQKLSTSSGKGASQETQQRELQKRVAELQDKLSKLVGGDLKTLIRHTHASKQHELMMSILRKRYPDTEEGFKEAGLEGEFDSARVGMPMRVEVPPTWDRELSEKGNFPTTWAALLRAKDQNGRYTLPYMALLRNIRNILLMGLSPSFLRAHVLQRLCNRGQIQGSGQTPVSLSHTWTMLAKEFDEAKLKELQEQSQAGVRDIMAYKSLLKKIRGPILGISDKVPGIIGEFLGAPVWEPCGLKKQGDCFLALNRVQLRDGKVLQKGRGKVGVRISRRRSGSL